MELLKKLLLTEAPSGNEEKIIDFIKQQIHDYVDEISIDVLGNLIALKKGKISHNRIMITSTIDEPGLMATVVEENGFVRFSVIGDVKASALLHKKVTFLNGATGIIDAEKEEGFTFKDLYLDPLGSEISVGDVASFDGTFSVNDNYVCAKGLSSRLGCYVMIRLMQELKACTNDLYFAFTVQGGLGFRGTKTAAFAIEPDYGLHVGATPSFDTPGEETASCKLGKGPAIKVMDSSILANSYIKDTLIETANTLFVPYQLEVSKIQSAAGVVHLTKGGVPTGAISVPIRYMNSFNEVCSVSDIENTIAVLRDSVCFGGMNE